MARTRQPSSERLDVLFARQVDALGAAGLRQEQIAARLGLTLWQVRSRLRRRGMRMRAETRVYDDRGSRCF